MILILQPFERLKVSSVTCDVEEIGSFFIIKNLLTPLLELAKKTLPLSLIFATAVKKSDDSCQ